MMRRAWPVVALGAAAQVSQLTILRELWAASYGLELSLALVLGLWLLGGAVGAAFVPRAAAGRSAAVVALASLILVPAALFLLRDLRCLAQAPVGSPVATSTLALAALASAVPVGALFGVQFTLAVRRTSPRVAYAAEAFGAAAGGLLLQLVPIDAFTATILAGSLSAAGATGKPVALVLASLTLAGPSLEVEASSRAWRRWTGGRLVFVEGRASPYGPVAHLRHDADEAIYQGGQLVASLPDRGEGAPMAHVVAGQLDKPRRVLVAGGALGGAIAPILLHPVERLDVVELDRVTLEMARPYVAGLDDPRVAVHYGDARRFLRSAGQYDVIWILAPEPMTASANRFYTKEFFAEARAHLAAGGVFALGPIRSHTTYAADAVLRRNGTLLRTLRSEFATVKMTAGTTTVFLCGAPNLDVERIVAGAPDVDVFGLLDPFYCRKTLHEVATGRALDIIRDEPTEVPAPGEVNTDAQPRVVVESSMLAAEAQRDPVRSWIARAASIPLAAWLAPLVLVIFARGPRWGGRAAMAAAGFAGMTIELILLLGFQASFGSVYRDVALLVGLFMLGLGAGSCVRVRAAPILVATVLLAVASGALPLWPAAPVAAYVALSLAGGFVVGALYPAVAVDANEAGAVYAADLVGALLGALVAGIVLVPVHGTFAAGLVASAFAAAALFSRRGSS